MTSSSAPWVIVLAAGSGTRLQDLTVGADGVAVPKQFCSLRGGRSLLIDAIGRARRLTLRSRIVVVVAPDHERWWRQQLDCIDPDNIIVQPSNKGTGAGVLLPLAHVLERDPRAQFVVLPSDHYVERTDVLLGSIVRALQQSQREPGRLMLLGITPDSPDTEYGWVVPGPRSGVVHSVRRFVEKPDGNRAAALLAAGAIWNSFVLAGCARSTWTICEQHLPAAATAIRTAFAKTTAAAGGVRRDALAMAYERLPALDFSRVVLERASADLRLVTVPDCGWTDLGTPRRVAECVAGIERRTGGQPPRAAWFPTVDLAAVLPRVHLGLAMA